MRGAEPDSFPQRQSLARKNLILGIFGNDEFKHGGDHFCLSGFSNARSPNPDQSAQVRSQPQAINHKVIFENIATELTEKTVDQKLQSTIKITNNKTKFFPHEIYSI